MKNQVTTRRLALPFHLPGTLPRALAVGGLALAALAPTVTAQYTSLQDMTSLGTDDIEITPDGRYAVVRDTAIMTGTHVFDLVEGTQVFSVFSAVGPDCPSAGTVSCSGPCNDAVEVTNDRAITLGQQVQLIDLTTQPPTRIAEVYCGLHPRDVSISGDGRFAIVRGGTGPSGGTYVIDMANGSVLLFTPSQNQDWALQLGNDLSAADAFHGVTLSYDIFTGQAGVVVVEFDPSTGGGPQIVFDTAMSTGLSGSPMDVAISPDGTHAVVRAENEVGLYRLDGVNTALVRTFNAFPGATVPFGTTAFDTVVINDNVWASISLGDPTIAQGYINVGDLATGMSWFAFLDGAPRDMALTPSGDKLLVHTSRRLYGFDLTGLPTSSALDNTQFVPSSATATGLLAGLDSIVCTEDFAVAITPEGLRTRMRIYDLTNGTKPRWVYGDIFDGRPIDLAIAEDDSFALGVTQQGYSLVDLRTLTMQLQRFNAFLSPGWPWADGAALLPKQGAAGGIAGEHWSNWLDGIDLVSRETVFCESFANSTGTVGDLYALGSTRVADNDLELHARFLPPNAAGFFLLSATAGTSPAGGGLLCLAGTTLNLPMVVASASGQASYALDLTNLPAAGGPIVAGSTWYAQLVHRDVPSAGAFNYTNGSELLFE